jgi:Mrp family chromosome partitioning ATPase
MSSNCDNDCGNCNQDCSDRKSFLEKQNELSNVKRVIGVVSGKGGVGKSMVTSLLAVLANRKGLKTAVLDADITGPSIPKAFGVHKRAESLDGKMILPAQTKTGIRVMSINLLLEDETKPVIWRGPILAGVLKQFWSDVVWGDVDFMFVDMPPGTGDVPLTAFQSLPLDGIVIVATPQELVSMIVEKAANMAKMMNIPILGLVENMSYYVCPSCHERHNIFGDSRIEETAAKYGIKNVAKLPVNSDLAAQCDKGLIELFEGDWLNSMSDSLENIKKEK